MAGRLRVWLVGIVVKFPDEGRIVRFGRADAESESATVIILPVIRIERYADAVAERRGAADAAAGRQWRPPPHEAPLKVVTAMSPRVRPLRATAPFAVFALLILAGCTSIGDFGRLQQPLVNDDIHAWVGQEAAAQAGGPVSVNNLTDDERTLRDLAFPLIEPPYDRQRWDAVVLEYGQNRDFRRSLWAFDPAAYYAHLIGPFHRSSSARYNQLIDDMRNDIVRIDPFFSTARRIVDIDRRREKSMQFVSDLESAGADQRDGAGRREQLDHRLGASFADGALRQLSLCARASDRRRADAGRRRGRTDS